MSNFLPGPYYVSDQTVEKNGRIIGTFDLLNKPGYHKSVTVIGTVIPYGGEGYQDKDTARATANLLSAAPEMYEAMKEFCERVERKEIGSVRTYEKFKAILAKADGITKPETQTA